ncbi:hypothetical protein PENSPDRAFT_732472 [Peniophora sp. CONT]|nr:hypothetical protein PENSPDRAFT_732472 [Peniophora sp. CONT]
MAGILWSVMGWHSSSEKSSILGTEAIVNVETVVNVETTRKSPLHALIIGIDTYKSERIPNLSGAAADANAMDEYLRLDLDVPTEQIVNLRNEQATRAAIIRSIEAFHTRGNIRTGDPILIYFAGHGCTTKAPKEWRVGTQNISMIVPYDTETDLGNAQTVIFDCCHSGSGTRDSRLSSSSYLRRERGFVSRCTVPADLDQHIWSRVPRGRDVGVVPGFARSGTKSHVLLAACRETERAFEDNSRGYFTRELIRTLRTVQPDKITYQDLVQRIPKMPGQTPQCEGYNANAILFKALVPSGRRAAYRVDLGKKGGTVVCAGSVHGVAEGDTFAIYPSRDFELGDEPMASMIAVKVHAFTTDMLGPVAYRVQDALANASPCFAIQTSVEKAAALRLHLPDAHSGQYERPVRAALEKVEQVHRVTGGPLIVIEDDQTLADLGMCASENDIAYTIHEPSVVALGLSRLHCTTKAEANSIQPVLSAAAHFFWHLHHAPKKNELNKLIDIQFYQLEIDEQAELGADLRRPWAARGPDLYNSGVVNVVADDDIPYGIVILNDSPVPLHVWAFYFNCSTLAISEYYRPPAYGGEAAAPLPARRSLTEEELAAGERTEGDYVKGELTIGYGAGGGQPYKFFLRDGQELDVGFIKLFITTEPVDLSGIAQRSPFAMARDGITAANPPAAVWDTAMITVVQRKL